MKLTTCPGEIGGTFTRNSRAEHERRMKLFVGLVGPEMERFVEETLRELHESGEDSSMYFEFGDQGKHLAALPGGFSGEVDDYTFLNTDPKLRPALELSAKEYNSLPISRPIGPRKVA